MNDGLCSQAFSTRGSPCVLHESVCRCCWPRCGCCLAPVGPSRTSTTRGCCAQPAVSARHVAFIYADDLWVAELDGQNVRRLTSDIGVESNPVFSPDGATIAFSAQYDGNIDVYTIPVERRRAGAADLAPGAGLRPRLHAGRQGGAVLLAAARVHRPLHATVHRAA